VESVARLGFGGGIFLFIGEGEEDGSGEILGGRFGGRRDRGGGRR
jgi:hypothetical protein